MLDLHLNLFEEGLRALSDGSGGTLELTDDQILVSYAIALLFNSCAVLAFMEWQYSQLPNFTFTLGKTAHLLIQDAVGRHARAVDDYGPKRGKSANQRRGLRGSHGRAPCLVIHK